MNDTAVSTERKLTEAMNGTEGIPKQEDVTGDVGNASGIHM